MENDNQRLASASRGPLDGIIAASSIMLGISSLVERVAATDVTVLVQGETVLVRN